MSGTPYRPKGTSQALPPSRTMPISNAPKALLVDLDGTLYRKRPLRWAMARELLLFGWRDLGLIRAFRQAHEELRERFRAEDDFELEDPFAAQLELAAKRLGLPASEREAQAARVRLWMVERPGRHLRRARREDLAAELRQARADGTRLALVSDYPARDKLRALELDELFEVVVASGEPDGPRTLKPNPGAFLLAAQRLGVAPAHCQVLGDRPDADGEAARRAGMDFRLIAD